MKLPDHPEARAVLARSYARDFRGYVERRNAKHPDRLTTVGDICRRFRMNQADVRACIEGGKSGLVVSEFAYIRPAGETWAEILVARFLPQHAPDAPLSRRLVSVVEEMNDLESMAAQDQR